VLPGFRANRRARDASRPATGHIDVAFEITRFGKGRAIEIRDESNATTDAKRHVLDVITTARFRPRPVGGRFGGTSPMVVRYYLYD
jgi:hypothetical protein